MLEVKKVQKHSPSAPESGDDPPTWKFTGQVCCDFCKYTCTTGEDNCPFILGWKEGQDKLTKWLDKPCPHYLTEDGVPLRKRRACDICCKDLGKTP